MIRFSKCLNILIDGAELLEDRLEPKAIPLDAKEKAQSRYESAIYMLLEQLSMRRTGWAVLHAIYGASLWRGKEVRITPFLRAYDPAEDRVTIVFLQGDRNRLDGHLYAQNAAVPMRRCPLAAEQDNSDGALLHELVHAVRQLFGQLKHAPDPVRGYGDEEEFFAELIANIYLSESGAYQLPESLFSSQLPDWFLQGPQGFLGDGNSSVTRRQVVNRRLLSKFLNENSSLCADICNKVKADFNPIREFMRNTHRYPLESK